MTDGDREHEPAGRLTGQRNGRVAARDKNQKAKSNFLKLVIMQERTCVEDKLC